MNFFETCGYGADKIYGAEQESNGRVAEPNLNLSAFLRPQNGLLKPAPTNPALSRARDWIGNPSLTPPPTKNPALSRALS